MADNYLENRMAEHLSGRRSTARTASTGLRLPLSIVLMDNVPQPVAAQIGRILTAAGIRVLATSTCALQPGMGVRIYTPDTDINADLQRRRETLTAIVAGAPSHPAITSNRIITLNQPLSENSINLQGGTPTAIAMMVLALSHADVQVEPQTIQL